MQDGVGYSSGCVSSAVIHDAWALSRAAETQCKSSGRQIHDAAIHKQIVFSLEPLKLDGQIDGPHDA